MILEGYLGLSTFLKAKTQGNKREISNVSSHIPNERKLPVPLGTLGSSREGLKGTKEKCQCLLPVPLCTLSQKTNSLYSYL